MLRGGLEGGREGGQGALGSRKASLKMVLLEELEAVNNCQAAVSRGRFSIQDEWRSH